MFLGCLSLNSFCLNPLIREEAQARTRSITLVITGKIYRPELAQSVEYGSENARVAVTLADNGLNPDTAIRLL